jgi:hypothetical protein
MPTLTSARAKALREKAIAVTEQNTKSVLGLAQVLWETYTHDVKINGEQIPLWSAWGHENWDQYVEVELGIHMTTAANFRRMHEVYSVQLKDSFDLNALDGISATKLKILTRVVSTRNISGWLKKAKKLSCCALEEEVMHAINGGGKVGAIHTLALLVTKSEQKRARQIIDQAMIDMKIERSGKALLTILEEWNTISVRDTVWHIP